MRRELGSVSECGRFPKLGCDTFANTTHRSHTTPVFAYLSGGGRGEGERVGKREGMEYIEEGGRGG